MNYFNLGTDLARTSPTRPVGPWGSRVSVRYEQDQAEPSRTALLIAQSRNLPAGGRESVAPSDDKERERSYENEMTALFFRALFKLGEFAGDWETWYGTRPLPFPRPERRSAAIQHPSNPSPTR